MFPLVQFIPKLIPTTNYPPPNPREWAQRKSLMGAGEWMACGYRVVWGAEEAQGRSDAPGRIAAEHTTALDVAQA